MTDAERSAIVAARFYGKRHEDGWTHWAILGSIEVLDALVEKGVLERRIMYGITKRPVIQFRVKPKGDDSGN